MIDRKIRSTRSKAESKKAHKQAVVTILALFVLFLVVTRIQDAIMTPFQDTAVPALGFLLAICVGMAIVGAVAYVVYRLAKRRQR